MAERKPDSAPTDAGAPSASQRVPPRLALFPPPSASIPLGLLPNKDALSVANWMLEAFRWRSWPGYCAWRLRIC